MFDAGEWNDNLEGATLLESLVTPWERRKTPATAQQEKGATSRRKRLKRNRELLELLHTLKSPSARNPELQPPSDLQPSAESPRPPGKQKAADVSSKKSSTTETPEPKASAADTENRMSRQQWRNKMKNKKKNRNKFKASLEEPNHGEEGVSMDNRGKKTKSGPQGGQGGGKAKRHETDNGPESSAHRKTKRRRHEEDNMGDGGSADTAEVQKKVQRKKKRPAEAVEDDVSGKKAGKKEKTSQGDLVTPKVTPLEKARLQKLKKLLQKEGTGRTTDTSAIETPDEEPTTITTTPGSNPPEEEEAVDRSASLRSRMEQRLSSARFRYINEQLYTSESQEAVRLFQSDPEAFTVYHTGFSQQVQRWPINPITEILKYIKNRKASLVVADFGCGDAQLARSVRNTVHSFDLVALNDRVTVCDMAEVPLSDATVDIAVFCLSLMGKNLSDFLREANRVLKPGGMLLVAEVSSRFDDIRQFLSAMSQLGFKSVNKNTNNTHFYLFEFSKVGPARDASRHPGLQLKPCLYKKR